MDISVAKISPKWKVCSRLQGQTLALLVRVFSFFVMFNLIDSGERLVGACSHCTVALTLAAVVPGHPGLLTTTHRGARLLDRKNPEQMDISTIAEVS